MKLVSTVLRVFLTIILPTDEFRTESQFTQNALKLSKLHVQLDPKKVSASSYSGSLHREK